MHNFVCLKLGFLRQELLGISGNGSDWHTVVALQDDTAPREAEVINYTGWVFKRLSKPHTSAPKTVRAMLTVHALEVCAWDMQPESRTFMNLFEALNFAYRNQPTVWLQPKKGSRILDFHNTEA